jgi:RNA polymerase sigma-70 factor (ECF subfamily)
VSETLARAAVGGETAFAAIVREHQAMVYSLACHFLRNQALAEELAQEVFLQLYRHLSSIKSAEHLRFWLRKVTTNRCIDSARAARTQTQVSLDDAPELIAPPSPLFDPALTGTLERHIAALPETPRMIIILRYQEELEPAEIAEILEMPVNTVKSHLRRSLAILRGKLTRTLGEVCI